MRLSISNRAPLIEPQQVVINYQVVTGQHDVTDSLRTMPHGKRNEGETIVMKQIVNAVNQQSHEWFLSLTKSTVRKTIFQSIVSYVRRNL